ncbi:MAG: cytidine deaminase [Candidatus Cloacimonas sp. SDB]|nr:MAG: cytidine deaminase [Candidatus Cloacimonas sp. SDB]
MDQELIDKAKEVSENAYAPYSGYKIGAALRTASGKIYTGCNVENSSYGLTICAERAAVFNAVSRGEKDFKEIVVFSDSDVLFTPCGACRQVLKEFSGSLKVTVISGKKILNTTVDDLLPHGFHL